MTEQTKPVKAKVSKWILSHDNISIWRFGTRFSIFTKLRICTAHCEKFTESKFTLLNLQRTDKYSAAWVTKYLTMMCIIRWAASTIPFSLGKQLMEAERTMTWATLTIPQRGIITMIRCWLKPSKIISCKKWKKIRNHNTDSGMWMPLMCKLPYAEINIFYTSNWLKHTYLTHTKKNISYFFYKKIDIEWNNAKLSKGPGCEWLML